VGTQTPEILTERENEDFCGDPTVQS